MSAPTTSFSQIEESAPSTSLNPIDEIAPSTSIGQIEETAPSTSLSPLDEDKNSEEPPFKKRVTWGNYVSNDEKEIPPGNEYSRYFFTYKVFFN